MLYSHFVDPHPKAWFCSSFSWSLNETLGAEGFTSCLTLNGGTQLATFLIKAREDVRAGIIQRF